MASAPTEQPGGGIPRQSSAADRGVQLLAKEKAGTSGFSGKQTRRGTSAEPEPIEPQPDPEPESKSTSGAPCFSSQGWTFRDDGLLVREANRDEAYTIDGFDGDYDALASAISDHVVASLERAPLNLRRVKLGAAGHRGVSENVFVSREPEAGTQGAAAPMLVLVPGIGTRAGVWGRSLCATAGLDAGSMRAFVRTARGRGFGRIVLLDPNDGEDPFDGERHALHCVLAWQELVERAALACEVFVVAHSYGGAALIDMLVRRRNFSRAGR